MPITPPPAPNSFQISNKWTPGSTYSSWVNNSLFPHIQNGANHPPYYQGSTTVFTTQNNKIDSSNLFPDHPKRAKVASVYPFPSIGTQGYVKLSELTQAELMQVTIKKFNQPETKLGANNIVGSSKLSKIDVDPSDPINRVISKDTNITKEDATQRTITALALGAAANLGNPRVTQLGSSVAGEVGETNTSLYNTTPFLNLKPIPYLPYQDFRSRRGTQPGDLIGKRLDGAATVARNALQGLSDGLARSTAYAAASATVGAYSAFNREATYGWGEHGNKYALRNDFTAKSHVATIWDNEKNEWKTPGIKDPVAKLTPFRGDKVTVIDFKTSTLAGVYNWDPLVSKDFTSGDKTKLGSAIGAKLNSIGTTQDFIKFFFTGPKLIPGDANKDESDDVMVFRAVITSLTDSFNPQWNPIQFIGRADPNYHYGGYARDINLDFTVYATDRDELKPIWRKLNALASYTAPEYDGSTIGLKGPWMRMTVGDLIYQQPMFISSLYYTLVDSDTTWEINIEKDPANMEVPKKIQVSLGATLVTDNLPQKGGKMYTLAKQFGANAVPKEGTDNWLSDMETNEQIIQKTIESFDNKRENQEETFNNNRELSKKLSQFFGL